MGSPVSKLQLDAHTSVLLEEGAGEGRSVGGENHLRSLRRRRDESGERRQEPDVEARLWLVEDHHHRRSLREERSGEEEEAELAVRQLRR